MAHGAGCPAPGKALEHNPPSSVSPTPQLLDCDQDLYKNFPLVISERWQQEVVDTIYDAVNTDTDKVEARRRAKNKQLGQEEGKLPFALGHQALTLRGRSLPRLGFLWVGRAKLRFSKPPGSTYWCS